MTLSVVVSWIKERLEWTKNISGTQIFFTRRLSKLVTPRLGNPPSCTCEPNTEENKDSIHLHGSHSPEDGPLLSLRIGSPRGFGSLCLAETFPSFPSPAPETIRGMKNSSGRHTELFYGLSRKHPTFAPPRNTNSPNDAAHSSVKVNVYEYLGYTTWSPGLSQILK
ncbi:hypothetical protein EYF80_034446 [Liparis tanakae]|uniref:Uncharacterized protein n=1 Tax=Liparis tanakae TaxID=230148 RepID=A0A4Z2GRM5_9TELE|nr:hypothetical protein EYF80_034446 [Liparis tanakae]